MLCFIYLNLSTVKPTSFFLKIHSAWVECSLVVTGLPIILDLASPWSCSTEQTGKGSNETQQSLEKLKYIQVGIEGRREIGWTQRRVPCHLLSLKSHQEGMTFLIITYPGCGTAWKSKVRSSKQAQRCAQMMCKRERQTQVWLKASSLDVVWEIW